MNFQSECLKCAKTILLVLLLCRLSVAHYVCRMSKIGTLGQNGCGTGQVDRRPLRQGGCGFYFIAVHCIYIILEGWSLSFSKNKKANMSTRTQRSGKTLISTGQCGGYYRVSLVDKNHHRIHFWLDCMKCKRAIVVTPVVNVPVTVPVPVTLC